MTLGEGPNAARVDWTFPIWPMVVFILQGAGIIWWGATLQARVDKLEDAAVDLKPVPSVLATLQERTLGIQRDVADIKQSLTRR